VADTLPLVAVNASLERWNQALGEELLVGQSAGIPFYLFLEPPQLKRVTAGAGGNEDGPRSLAEAVGRSLDWREGTSPFVQHLQAMRPSPRAGGRAPAREMATEIKSRGRRTRSSGGRSIG
jgi:hypothetical protein